MDYTFLKLVEDTLKEAKTPLTAKEIWDKSKEYGFQSKLKTKGKTPCASIVSQLGTNIKKGNSIFVRTSKGKYSLKELVKPVTPPIAPKPEKEPFSERDLHPLLVKYTHGNPHFRCYTKTIHHEVSSKHTKGKNKWLHPDIVGVYFPFDDFEESTMQIIDNFSESVLKLFSFEMKKEVDETNLREYFFQAVSNSSWANEGYLVVLKYKKESELMDEMRRLNNAFGIGFIKLNAENISQSEILISAQRKSNIDWDTINRLSKNNEDFKKFIDSINEDYQLKKVKSTYDPVFDNSEMVKYVKDKNII